MDFLDTGGITLLNTNIEEGLGQMGLLPSETVVASRLSDYEAQRWYEMYYVAMIKEHGKCSTSLYPCYDPIIVNQIAAKYGLVDIPCASADLLPQEYGLIYPLIQDRPAFSEQPEPKKRKGGRPRTGKTAIDYEGIEKLRASLMKCKAPDVIAKELDTSGSTVYSAMKINMFAGKHELKKTIPFHVETIKRLIINNEITWELYVKRYAICETALMKALYKSNPEFVNLNNIHPTKSSLEYELNKFKGNRSTVAKAYGVPEIIVKDWIKAHDIGGVEHPKEMTKSATAKSLRKNADLTYDEQLARLGIDPQYDPLAADREKWNRDYQTG